MVPRVTSFLEKNDRIEAVVNFIKIKNKHILDKVIWNQHNFLFWVMVLIYIAV